MQSSHSDMVHKEECLLPVRLEPGDLFVGDLRPSSGQVDVQKAMSKIEKVHRVFPNDG